MTTSNARKINSRPKQQSSITMIKSRSSLAAQKMTGLAMLLLLTAAVAAGEVCAAVMLPMAAAAVFSKEKLLDFGIFGKLPENDRLTDTVPRQPRKVSLP